MTAFEDLRRIQAQLEAAPPWPSAIMASHSVPYGKSYRQWDSLGRLLIWVNRGRVADMPRARAHSGWGIPVFYV